MQQNNNLGAHLLMLGAGLVGNFFLVKYGTRVTDDDNDFFAADSLDGAMKQAEGKYGDSPRLKNNYDAAAAAAAERKYSQLFTNLGKQTFNLFTPAKEKKELMKHGLGTIELIRAQFKRDISRQTTIVGDEIFRPSESSNFPEMVWKKVKEEMKWTQEEEKVMLTQALGAGGDGGIIGQMKKLKKKGFVMGMSQVSGCGITVIEYPFIFKRILHKVWTAVNPHAVGYCLQDQKYDFSNETARVEWTFLPRSAIDKYCLKKGGPDVERAVKYAKSMSTTACRFAWDCEQGEACTGNFLDKLLKKGVCVRASADPADPPKDDYTSNTSGGCRRDKDCLNKVKKFVNALRPFVRNYVVTGSVAYMALTGDFRIRANDVDVIIPNTIHSVEQGILYLNSKKTPFKTDSKFKSESMDSVRGLPIFYTLPSGQVLKVDLIINKRSQSFPEYEVIDGLHILKAEDLLRQYKDVAETRGDFGEEGRNDTDSKIRTLKKLKTQASSTDEAKEEKKPLDSSSAQANLEKAANRIGLTYKTYKQPGSCRFARDCEQGEACTGNFWDKILNKGVCVRASADPADPPKDDYASNTSGGCRRDKDCGQGEACTGNFLDKLLKKGVCEAQAAKVERQRRQQMRQRRQQELERQRQQEELERQRQQQRRQQEAQRGEAASRLQALARGTLERQRRQQKRQLEVERLERQLEQLEEEDDDAPPDVLQQQTRQTMTDVKEITAPAPEEVTAEDAIKAYNRGQNVVIDAWEALCPTFSKDSCKTKRNCKTGPDGKCAVNKAQIIYDMRDNI